MRTKTVEEYVIAPTNSLPGYNEIFTESKDISIFLDYPLDADGFYFNYHNKNGFTVGKIIKLIKKCYRKIYNDKDKDKYGIWGHGIGDLCIERIKTNKKGDAITVNIGS